MGALLFIPDHGVISMNPGGLNTDMVIRLVSIPLGPVQESVYVVVFFGLMAKLGFAVDTV